MENLLGWLGVAGSIVVTLVGVYFRYHRYQTEARRSRDVAAWADDAIDTLVTVEVCAKAPCPLPEDERAKLLAKAYVSASVLTEQGRLFFPNVDGDAYVKSGRTYQGRRPKLLDPLVVAHKAARRMLEKPEEPTTDLLALLVAQRKDFMSHVQVEIGRRRANAKDSRLGGMTADLDEMIAQAKSQA
ncbi:hypothetical protein [Erythrobacter sp. HKB08]|uniref:hypothetical protein n=1 Tax=Erythrobacter sp. HKB08 TaxID=2502843 RepID=UPI0010092555|nr:hypothetical protein [Erythrobacter sp. HKB08]